MQIVYYEKTEKTKGKSVVNQQKGRAAAETSLAVTADAQAKQDFVTTRICDMAGVVIDGSELGVGSQ